MKKCINCLYCKCISGDKLSFICVKNGWKGGKNDKTLIENSCNQFKVDYILE